ncbi:DUF1841 family protein [Thiobacter aerophilum]|uniref:DUF1841 family protein n=1 Tax=Thiobacter aerophilum TaxID=3121275 RepID=A0ABV0EF25_9BURK
MFDPDREQVRRFYCETWRKYRDREPLQGSETLAIEVILLHPEYHGVLAQPERYVDRDYPPEMGAVNPFLHLSVHLAILEQLSIDQPAGIRSRYQKLLASGLDAHDAQHALGECLMEMIWQAQHHHTPPDAAVYLRCLDDKLGA